MKNEFKSYYVNHLGKPSSHLDYFENNISSSMTPYILEEREMRATQIDIFSRLMRDRLIWISGPVEDRMATIIQAQLMFLDSSDKTDITIHVDSPGGSVKAGLSIVDVMDYIACDVRTVNTGMAASMGSIILGAGTKGKRSRQRRNQVRRQKDHQTLPDHQHPLRSDLGHPVGHGRYRSSRLLGYPGSILHSVHRPCHQHHVAA